MEIRVNKLSRYLFGNTERDSIDKIGAILEISDLNVNAKLSISVIDSDSDIINLNKLNDCEMLDLHLIKNKIEAVIERKAARIQLEVAIQRLAFLDIKEIKCEGYFISKIEQ